MSTVRRELLSTPRRILFYIFSHSALVAQLDRVPGFEPGCREFESLRVHQFYIKIWGTVTTQTIISIVLPLGLAIAMFGLGLKLTIQDFTRLLQMRRLVLIGLFCQIILLPTIAFLIAKFFSLSPVYAMGLMLLAASPGGATANIMSHFAGGNVALNITLTGLNALTALITMPLFIQFSYEYFFASQASVPVDASKIIQILFVITLPMGLAMWLKNKKPQLALKLQKPLNAFSLIFLAFVAIAAVVKEKELLLSGIAPVGFAVLVFNLASFAIGYGFPRALKAPKEESISIAMEVGIHNSTLAMAIAMSPALMNSTAMATPAALYTIVMYAVAAIWIQFLKRG